jgi:hypothetical protein
MNRRELIAGAAGLAAARAFANALPYAAGALQAATATRAPEAPLKQRSAPVNPLTLESSELAVVFDPHHGLPYSYQYKGQRLWGESEGEPLRAILCRLQPREYRTVTVEALTPQQTEKAIRFPFRAIYEGQGAARFHLVYTIDGHTLVVTMDHIEEEQGFQLIEMALPQLVAVREQEGPAWMAEGRHSGSFVRLSEAKAFRFPDNEYFGRISTELPVGMVGQNGIGCVMEVTAYMDGTETEIKGVAGERRALLGTVQTYRVHGGRCYSMNDGGEPVCGNAQTLNLLVEQPSRCRFDFFSTADEAQPWLTGAKLIRERAPASPTQFFSDRFLYILAGKKKTEAEPHTTFAQSRQIVEDVAKLTDYAPQTVFISGWVYDGQDTGYPSEDKINSSLGDYAELRALIEGGKLLNANVTLNTNYDDAYKSSPLFDEAFIARRPDGALWASRAWAGEMSYIVGMAKYVEGGWASRRIAYTLDRYKIENSILIDAMSWFAIRNDWDPKHPASGYTNLVEGKYKIVDQFRERGIAVTSEQMRYPFVGKLAETMDGPDVSECPFGGEAIPLVATVFRGSAIWGTTNGPLANEPQQQLFWNTRSTLWFEASTDRAKFTDFYYLIVLPYSKLHTLAVEQYESHGPVRRLLLQQQSEVTMDTAGDAYSAKFNGLEIARDNATFCPIDAHRIAFYARTARRLSYPLPAGWRSDEITARKLTTAGRVPWKSQCSGGMLTVDVEANTPVIVYANESAMHTAAQHASPQ